MGKNKDVSLGIFRDTIFLNSIVPALNDIVEKADANVVRAQFALSPLLENIRSLFQYVYIPKDIEPEKLVQFETKEIQTLLGKKLEDIVAGFLTKEKVKNISKELKQFVEE